MSIMRAIVKGSIAGTVQTRNMFTADVVPSGGDTAEVLWSAYLHGIYDQIFPMTTPLWSSSTYELQAPLGSQWETTDEVAFALTGSGTGEALPNIVSLVLLGKAAGIRHIGRKFFSGLVEGATVGNVLAGAVVAQVATALLGYITPFTGIGGGTLTPGVRTEGGVFHPFVGGVVSSLMGSMRRRKPGLGI